MPRRDVKFSHRAVVHRSGTGLATPEQLGDGQQGQPHTDDGDHPPAEADAESQQTDSTAGDGELLCSVHSVDYSFPRVRLLGDAFGGVLHLPPIFSLASEFAD